MARPLRIEFPGAVYHVTARGDRREPIFVDDVDRAALLGVAAAALRRHEARALAWCLMGNHYHFVLQTAHANLSALMRQINGVTTQRFNKRHAKVGHLFQGRYHAVLVDRESYLLQACRYVDLNPVRAGLVDDPARWRWSSYAANAGLAAPPDWLDRAALWSQLLGQADGAPVDAATAAARYRDFVAAGRSLPLWDEALRQQIYLGGTAFVERMQAQVMPERAGAVEVPRLQRACPQSLAHWLEVCANRDEAIVRAHCDSQLSLTTIARELGLSVSRVSRIASQSGVRSCLLPPPGAKGKT